MHNKKNVNYLKSLRKKITEWKVLGAPLLSFNLIIITPDEDFDWNKRSIYDSIIYPLNKYIIYKTPNILKPGVQKIVTDADMK